MRALIVLAALCAVMGCCEQGAADKASPRPLSRGGPTEPAAEGQSPAGALVATSADDQVTLTELQAFLDGFSPARQAEIAAPEGRRTFLRNYLLYRAALRRAEAAGYADDPRVRRVRDRAMAQRWTEDHVATFQSPPISDEEARAHWERTRPPDRPDRVRARYIRLSDVASAEALRGDLLSAMAQSGADAEALFTAAALEHSIDEATRGKGGDLLFFSRGGDEIAWRLAPRIVLEAALAMHVTGQLSRTLESPEGAHLVMVTARREAEHRTFEEASARIRGALARERTKSAQEAVESELLDMDDWTVDDGSLEDLVVAPMVE